MYLVGNLLASDNVFRDDIDQIDAVISVIKTVYGVLETSILHLFKCRNV